jgi:hypothetical protein
MDRQPSFLLIVAVATATAMPAMGQTSSAGSAIGETIGAEAIPNFSRVWTHPAFPWFEPPASGPGPITNLSRWPVQRPSGESGSVALPATKEGISNYDQMVGNYKDPILKPWAAEVVRRHGELSLVSAVPNASNQCWPYPPPFIYKHALMQMFQQKDRVLMLYNGGQMRQVRLNAAHPLPLEPSWFGDSVGQYEGDTLVIDTVGVKTDRPYAMMDLFGTPYTDKLHMVERYRLRDWDDVKDALERNKKENWLNQGDVWTPQRDKKFLQAHVTIEDEGVFNSPWTATLTYAPGPDRIGEGVCADNRMEYYHGVNSKEANVPKAEKPDF